MLQGIPEPVLVLGIALAAMAALFVLTQRLQRWKRTPTVASRMRELRQLTHSDAAAASLLAAERARQPTKSELECLGDVVRRLRRERRR